MPALGLGGRVVGEAGHRLIDVGGVSVAADVTVTAARAVVHRPASNRFNLGITFTQDTFPASANATSVLAAKSLLTALNLDYVNMHNHMFGASGPWTNADRAAGRLYANRASWTGWAAWDQRYQHLRDCAGAFGKSVITLLPPGHLRMDGGSKTNSASDPLGLGRTWDNLDNVDSARVTDLHESDLVDLARAVVERHPEIYAVSYLNEQKGNFAGAGEPAEQSANGLSNIFNYFHQERVQEALALALPSTQVWGPYLVLEGGGHDGLATTYAADGFPQPAGAADATHYHQYYATVEPLRASTTKTYLEQWIARVAATARNNWMTVDFKVYAGDNEQANWNVIYPWTWYFMEKVRKALQQLRALVGYTAAFKIIGAEDYWRKVQDDTNVQGDNEQGALAAELLRIELEELLHGSLRWAPEQGANKLNRCNLFSSTVDTVANGGAQPYPAYYAYKIFCDNFRGRDVYLATSSDDKRVTAVANDAQVLLINHQNSQVAVAVNAATPVTLNPFEFRMVTA